MSNGLYVRGIRGRFVGLLRQDGVFVINKDFEEHVMHKYDSLAISAEVLKNLYTGKLRCGHTPCRLIRVILRYEQSEDVFETTPEYWYETGVPINYDEPQLMMPLGKFNRLAVLAQNEI